MIVQVVMSLIIAVSTSIIQTRETKTADQLHSYFVANYKHFGKEWQNALSWYKRTLALESPVFANKGLVHFLHDTNNDTLIIQLKSVIEKEFKDDIELQFILAKAYSNSGDQNGAHELLIALNQKAKNHQEIAFHTAQAYLERKEPENAIKVIDSLLNNAVRKPTHFVFHFLKAQIYMQLNKKDEALASIKTSLELHPRFEKGWLLKALLEEKMGRIQDAIKGFTNFLELGGPNQEIEQHLLALTFKQKALEHQLPTATLPQDCLAQALALFEQQKYKQAMAELQTFLEQQPNNNEAKILKIQILTAMNDTKQALQDLKAWAVNDPDHPLWFNTLHLFYRNGNDPHSIIKLLHEIEKQKPDHLLPALYLADMYLRTHSHHAAHTYLVRCIKNTTNSSLQAELAFQLSALAYDKKQYKHLKEYERLYGAALNQHAPFLNLMAYYYSNREHNAQKAHEYIGKALKLDPHNPHLLDTQALIYFQSKEYVKAQNILEAIAEQEPNDYTIAKHLAKTYRQTGDHAKAQATLEKVISLVSSDQKQQKYRQLLSSWTKKP